ncbi:hypothetical protein HWV62_21904 [Athelia sp. TMB]|nr:hypothetical protein HWV62_21904 [Athelia sp. TMB]
MILNHTIKFEWLREHWGEEAYQDARLMVRDVMLKHRSAIRARETSMPNSTPRRRSVAASSSRAVGAQQSGLDRFDSLRQSLSKSASVESTESTPETGDSEVDAARLARQARLEDEAIVDRELTQFIGDGIIEKGHPEWELFKIDVLKYWQAKQGFYPLLFCLAVDVLPVQASAVPCERVFSSSKLTDESHRSNLSPFTMEMLQILKYRFRAERLTFTDGLVSDTRELSVIDVPAEKIDELLAEGRISELKDMFIASWRAYEAEGNSDPRSYLD